MLHVWCGKRAQARESSSVRYWVYRRRRFIVGSNRGGWYLKRLIVAIENSLCRKWIKQKHPKSQIYSSGLSFPNTILAREGSRPYQQECHGFLQKRWTAYSHGTGCCNADTPHARRHAFTTRKYYLQRLSDTPHGHADTLATIPR
jgi:hypothetical protein